MKGFYLVFAGLLFLLFCGLQYKGINFDANHRSGHPKYFSYRGGSSSSGGGYYGSSRRRGYYSHK